MNTYRIFIDKKFWKIKSCNKFQNWTEYSHSVPMREATVVPNSPLRLQVVKYVSSWLTDLFCDYWIENINSWKEERMFLFVSPECVLRFDSLKFINIFKHYAIEAMWCCRRTGPVCSATLSCHPSFGLGVYQPFFSCICDSVLNEYWARERE